MLVASFNVNSVRARLSVLEKWLQKAKPDLVCLQETKVIDKDFPADDIKNFGYDAVFMGEKSYNGVAILSSKGFDEVSYGFDGKGIDEGTRLIRVSVLGFTVLNSYIPQGTSPDSEKFVYKLNFFKRISEYISAMKKPGNLLWVGDFNVAPESIDVHDPKRLYGHIGFHPEEHKALAKVKALGFTDILRKHKPGPGEYTFWDYRVRDSVSRGLGWRVDHIWALGRTAELSVDAWIDREPRLMEKPSDHTPILAEFKI